MRAFFLLLVRALNGRARTTGFDWVSLDLDIWLEDIDTGHCPEKGAALSAVSLDSV